MASKVVSACVLLTLLALNLSGPAIAQQDQGVELVSQIGGGANGVAIQGPHAYVGVGPRLVILDIDDPARPGMAGQTEVLAGIVRRVAVDGDYAYLADGANGLRIIDISDPTAPSDAGPYDTAAVAAEVVVVGGLAYVADVVSGLHIIDISDPTNPTEVGNLDFPDIIEGIAVVGHHAYVTAYRGADLRVIDIASPAVPTEVSSLDLPGTPGILAVPMTSRMSSGLRPACISSV